MRLRCLRFFDTLALAPAARLAKVQQNFPPSAEPSKFCFTIVSKAQTAQIFNAPALLDIFLRRTIIKTVRNESFFFENEARNA